MNVLLEYLIVFVALWVCFYFIIIVPKLKKKKEKIDYERIAEQKAE